MLSDGEEMFTGDSNFAVHLDLSSDLLLPNGDEPDMIDEELMAICRNSEFNRSSPVASQEGDSRFGLTFEPLVEEDEDEEDESPSASIGANVTSQPQQITEENQQQPLTNENFQLAYTFTCEVCGFEAENRRKFMIHKRSHGGRKLHDCNECSAKFTRPYALKRHKTEKHSKVAAKNTGRAIRYCSFPGCSHISYSHATFTLHRRSHETPKPFFCKQCHLTYVHKKSLVQHLARNHSSNQELFGSSLSEPKPKLRQILPKIAGGVILQRQTVSDLLSSVTANKSPPRPEPQQIIGTTSTRSSTSSSAKDFIQPPMDVQPETKDYRSEESATEDINDENSRSADEIFRCDRCDYISASFKGLFAHKLRDHSAAGKKDKNHPNIGCLYCSQKFSAADKLVSHIKQKHRGPPKRKSIYSCKKCEFSTTTKRVFIAHRKSHNVNEEREETEVAEVSSVTVISKGSYRCPHCVFETNIEASLDIHVSQVHRGPQGSAGDFSPTIGNRQKGSPHKNQPDNNGFTVSSGKKVMNVVVPTKYADPVQNIPDRNQLDGPAGLFSSGDNLFSALDQMTRTSPSRSLPDGLPSSSGNLQIPPSLTSVGGSDNVVNEQLFSCLSQQQVLNANLLKVCRQQSVELSELRGFVSQLLGFLFPSRKISIEQLVSGNNIDSLVKEIVADCVSRFQK